MHVQVDQNTTSLEVTDALISLASQLPLGWPQKIYKKIIFAGERFFEKNQNFNRLRTIKIFPAASRDT